MTRMARAAIYEAPNAPFVVREYPLRSVGPAEVLVRVTMSTICGSDISSFEGRRPNPCPGILGHEIIGVITEIGSQVTHDLCDQHLAVGDRITWTEYFTEGNSYYKDVIDMPQKSPGLRKYGHVLVDDDPHFLGGFAEYCYVMPGTGILKLPDELTDEEATPLNCGIATMVAVTEASNIGLGDAVVIQGLGLLGLFGCAMAKARGARLIIGLDGVASRRAMATHMGADQTLDVTGYSTDELVRVVRRLCSPHGADVVIEVCGVPDVVSDGLRLLRNGGRYTLAGLVYPGANISLDASDLIRKWITLRGIHNYHPRHLVQALDFVLTNRHRFPFRDIVDSKFSLDQLNEAFKRASERTALRAAVVPWHHQ